ncbi:primosomal protein N' [Ktedonosporobacter rubrisoli]|uniref:Replication restart protein PriA n=1 Tax=Ktedonosporobacter rubrisoli TaxID=2509675 RepID=A0A4P6JVX2_KTERU|nr:primosomal protein N' [Ktedonosporobacter rubrisoli]QBD79828.1 primosomal protein N' [Ktedonosporobacter rubrisoli]
MLADVLTSAASWDSERPLLTYLVPLELETTVRIGQLVAIPYGERLVEGILWVLHAEDQDELLAELGAEVTLRPLHAILDPEPALLPHQLALSQWISAYYVTPLAQVAQMMLPPGLMQRSQFVLRLSETYEPGQDLQESSLHLRALLGLLHEEGEVDDARLKKLLGPARAKAILQEIKHSNLIARDPRLYAPKARARTKRLVRLCADEERLAAWKRHQEEILQPVELEPAYVVAALTPLPAAVRSAARRAPNPWEATATMLEKEDKAVVQARRQLAAVELLQQGATPWTQGALSKATGLTSAQLQNMLREQIVKIETEELRRDPLRGRSIPASAPLPLTADQARAVQAILAADKTPILLHGVTGSGKTEVYLQALAALIAKGKRGIILVPEIALTTQAVQRVAGRFPERVAIIHSDLSIGERYDEWRRIRAGEVDIVIGSRSALFAPLPDLGLIIIDEEHEPAYKQGELRPTYHARECALILGQLLDIPVVLGSATPAVETFYRARQGEFRLVELPGRIGSALPPVEVIDLRNELHAGNTSILSRRLQEELERVLAQGQQAILFLNRRGAASCVLCRDCGFVAVCDACDLPLTYHATERILLCHYCGKRSKVLHFCPSCHSSSIRYFGLGTEKVQETIQRLFPQARLLRWDRDTARHRSAHEQLLERFANREADILIGTQMIAKGLDLPGVTLVGVVSADIALNLPDYSAAERAFTLLTQVAGRAGRGSQAGHVIIQTFNPQHFCIELASRHDYHAFYATEIEARQRYGYPPFRRFVKFTYSHEQRHRCQNEALLLSERLTEWIARLGLRETSLVGPAPAFMERMRGKYRWQIILRGPDLHQLLRVIDAPGWEIDIDPISTM